MMTDQNTNKIDVPAQEGPSPDGHETSLTATPGVGPISADDGTLLPHLPDSADAVATSGIIPIANPFEGVILGCS